MATMPNSIPLDGWEKWISDDDDGDGDTVTIGIRDELGHLMVAERVPHYYAELLLLAPTMLAELRDTVTWIEDMAKAIFEASQGLAKSRAKQFVTINAKLRGRARLIDLMLGDDLPATQSSGKAVS